MPFYGHNSSGRDCSFGFAVDHKMPESVKLSYGQRSHLESPRKAPENPHTPSLNHNDCMRASVRE